MIFGCYQGLDQYCITQDPVFMDLVLISLQDSSAVLRRGFLRQNTALIKLPPFKFLGSHEKPRVNRPLVVSEHSKLLEIQG